MSNPGEVIQQGVMSQHPDELPGSESKKLLNAVFEASPDMLFVLNADGYPLRCNNNSVQMFQYPPSVMPNRHLSRLIGPDLNSKGDSQQVIQALKANRPVNNLHWTAQRQNGTNFPINVSITPLPEGICIDGQDACTLVTVRDDSERLAFEERIIHLAHFDPVTGMINRNLLKDRALQAISRAKRSESKMAFLFLDLDHFKQVNDLYGHLVGDHLLKAAGLRVQSALRNEDTLGRFGGDEFLILNEGISCAEDARLIGEKIIRKLAEPFGIDGHRLHISASIGVALYPDHGQSLTNLVNRADQAMYYAKNLGRNTLAIYNSDAK